jgi:hypothetical protein
VTGIKSNRSIKIIYNCKIKGTEEGSENKNEKWRRRTRKKES